MKAAASVRKSRPIFLIVSTGDATMNDPGSKAWGWDCTSPMRLSPGRGGGYGWRVSQGKEAHFIFRCRCSHTQPHTGQAPSAMLRSARVTPTIYGIGGSTDHGRGGLCDRLGTVL